MKDTNNYSSFTAANTNSLYLYYLVFALFWQSPVYVVILTTDAFVSRKKNGYCCRYVICLAFLHGGRRNCGHVLLLRNALMSCKASQSFPHSEVGSNHVYWTYTCLSMKVLCGNVSADTKHRTPSVLGHCKSENVLFFFFIFIVWHRRSFASTSFTYFFCFTSYCGTL